MEKAIRSKLITNQTTIKNRQYISIDDYFHVLNKEETTCLFESLGSLLLRIIELELQNKKLRRKFALGKKDLNYSTNQSDSMMKVDSQNSPKDFLTTSTLAGISQHDMILNGQKNENHAADIENSYLLTELDSVTSRTASPNVSVLNTSGNLRP